MRQLKNCVFGLIVLLALPGQAQRVAILHIDHKNTTDNLIQMTFEREGRRDFTFKRRPDEPIDLYLKPGENLLVRIDNPLLGLYGYSAEETKPEATPNALAYQKFYESLVKLQNVLEERSSESTDAKGDNENATESQREAQEVENNLEKATAGSLSYHNVCDDEESVQKQKAREKRHVERLLAATQAEFKIRESWGKVAEKMVDRKYEIRCLVSKMIALLKKINPSAIESDEDFNDIARAVQNFKPAEVKKQWLAYVADYASSIEYLLEQERNLSSMYLVPSEKLSELKTELKQLNAALEGFKHQKARKSSDEIDYDISMTEEKISNLREKIDDVEKRRRSVLDGGEKKGQEFLVRQGYLHYLLIWLESVVARVQEERAIIEAGLDALSGLEKSFNEKDTPLDFLFTGLESGTQKTVKLTIAKNPELGKKFDSDRFVGLLQFKLVPYSRFKLSVGPSVVYSFVKARTYTTLDLSPPGDADPAKLLEDAEEGYKIIVAEEDRQKYAVSGFLQITPRSWDDPDISTSIDVGLASDNDELGFLLGGTLRFFNYRSGISAGVIYQRVTQLDPNLHLGQVLDSAELLKTQKGYEAGLYVGITIKTP